MTRAANFLSAASLLCSISLLNLTGCGGGGSTPAASTKETNPEVATTAAAAHASANAPLPTTINYEAQPSIYSSGEQSPIINPVVVIHTSAGDIQIELLMEKAPQTVGNFLDNYARQGAYEGTIFHYVDPQGFILGGGYTPELEARPTRGGIFNESSSGVPHERGTVAMSREPNDPHSATCQFFINVVDNLGLNYQGDQPDQRGYCVFGKVTQGMEIVDRIAAAAVAPKEGFDNLPSQPVVIESVEELR